MDNFRWLEEKEKTKKPQWLKNYSLHIVAGVIIVLLLLYLVFGSGSSESTSSETTAEVPMNNTGAPEVATKQITIRLPDKSTKIVNPDQPMLEQPSHAEQTESNAAAEANRTRHSLSLKPLDGGTDNVESVESAASVEESAAATAATNADKPPRTSSRLIQPANTASSTIGAIPPKTPAPQTSTHTTPTTPVVETPAVPVEPTQTASAASQALTLTPPAQTTTKPAAPPAATTTTNTPSPANTPPIAPEASKEPTIAPATSASVNLHWLLQRKPSHYTVQLFASHDENLVKNFITQHNLSGKAVYAEIRQNSQDWYIVLMGDYATRDQALSAITQLSAPIQAQSPWARSMQSVQDAVRKRLAYGD